MPNPPQAIPQVYLGGVDYTGIAGSELSRLLLPHQQPQRDQGYYDSLELEAR